MDLNQMMQNEDKKKAYEKEYKEVYDKYWGLIDLINAYDKESELDNKSIENTCNIIKDFTDFFQEKGFEILEEKADWRSDFKINVSAKYETLVFRLSIPVNSKGWFDFDKVKGKNKEKIFLDLRVMPIRNFNISIDEDIDIKYAKDAHELKQLKEKLELDLEKFNSMKNASSINYKFEICVMPNNSTEIKTYNRFLDVLKEWVN